MKLKNENILDNQIKEFVKEMRPNYSYDFIKNLENFFNAAVGGHQPAPYIKDSINGRIFEIRLECKSSFGSVNEELLGNFIKTASPDLTKLFPNGNMNFPDMEYNGVNVDFKAVLCSKYKDGCDLISPQYSSTLGCVETIDKIVTECKEHENSGLADAKHASSLICITYYSVDDNDVATIEYVKIVPILFFIKTRKDLSNWGTKRGGVDLNCTGGLTILKGSYREYINKLYTVLQNRTSNEVTNI